MLSFVWLCVRGIVAFSQLLLLWLVIAVAGGLVVALYLVTDGSHRGSSYSVSYLSRSDRRTFEDRCRC